MFYDSLCIYHTVWLSNNSPITIEMLSCNKCHTCVFHSFIEQNMLGNEPLYYKFDIWSLNSSLNIRFSQFQKFSKLMVLYERLQMLYEPKIQVTGSFRKLSHILYERSYGFLMRQMQFRPDIQPLCIFCTNKWAAIWDFQQCGTCEYQRLRPACAYAQSDQSLCKSLKNYWLISIWTF